MLKYLHKEGCPWNEDILHMAVYRPNQPLELIKYAHLFKNQKSKKEKKRKKREKRK